MPPNLPSHSKKLTRQLDRYVKNVVSDDAVAQLSGFFASVDKSYEEFEDRVKFTTRSLEISSQEQNTLNLELEKLNASMAAMFDGLGQGLVFFDRNGICASVYSQACLELLGTAPAELPIVEILQLTPRQRDEFSSWLEVVFNSNSALSFDDLKSLAPDHLINENKQYIALDYRPIYLNSDDISAVMLIATDQTTEREAESKIQETRDESKKIQSIARRRNEFWRFQYNFRLFLRAELPDNSADLMRILHTYKGLSQLFGLKELAEALHDAENKITTGSNQAILENDLLVITALLNEASALAEDLFGPDYLDEGQVRVVEYQKILALEDKISALAPSAREGLLEYVHEELLGLSISECCDAFTSEICRLAEIQGKPEPVFEFFGEDLKIVLRPYEEFFDGLVHLSRNIVDHGIEMPSQRRHIGKPDGGQIKISLQLLTSEQMYELIIEDDGRGFDVNKIAQKLIDRGIKIEGLTPPDIISYIFEPDISTAAGVTSVSGRGSGLYALKSIVESLDGSVKAEPVATGGARFIFRFKAQT